MFETVTRRQFLRTTAAAGLAAALAPRKVSAAPAGPARIAITLDLEMSRNFPTWETTHWDYEKGNLDADTKQYAVEAARRVHDRGGRIHFFCVGRVLEQGDVSWLKQLSVDGHPIGNHTYDHVNVLATRPQDIQYRFQRAPWLIEGMTPAEAIEKNVRMTTRALEQRLEVQNSGFRTPGGFSEGLAGREDLQQMLLRAGFSWVSSKYPAHTPATAEQKPTPALLENIVAAQAKAQPFVYPTGLIEIPMSPISDIGAFRTGRWKTEWFLEAIREAMAWTIEHGAVFDFLAHPSCLVAADPQFQAIDLICELVEKSQGRAQLTTLDKIAAEQKPAPPTEK